MYVCLVGGIKGMDQTLVKPNILWIVPFLFLLLQSSQTQIISRGRNSFSPQHCNSLVGAWRTFGQSALFPTPYMMSRGRGCCCCYHPCHLLYITPVMGCLHFRGSGDTHLRCQGWFLYLEQWTLQFFPIMPGQRAIGIMEPEPFSALRSMLPVTWKTGTLDH